MLKKLGFLDFGEGDFSALHLLEHISVALVIYGPDDKLVFCNEKYRSMNEDVRQILVPGASFLELCEAVKYDREVGDFSGDDWLKERDQRFRNPSEPFEERHSDGRWLLVEEFRTKDNFHVGMRTEITDKKRAEKELQQSEDRYRDLGSGPIKGIP